MERHAHPCQSQHGQIICPIAYSHHLIQINPFTPGNLLKQRRLPSPIHNRPAHRPRHQPAVEDRANGHRRRTREGLDPDDFRSGFVSWSGTSFAAPALCAWLGQAMLAAAADNGLKLSGPTAADAMARAIQAITCRQQQES